MPSLLSTRVFVALFVCASIGCGGPLVGSEENGDDGQTKEGCGDGQPVAGEFCHSVKTTSLPSRTFMAGDFNADGQMDVGSVGVSSGIVTFAYWAGDGSGGFSADPVVIEMPEDGLFRTAAELDGNVGTDFVVVDNSTGEIHAYLNDSGEFQPPITSSVGVGDLPWNTVTLIDVQGDGKADLLVEPFGGIGPIHMVINNDAVFQSDPFTIETEPGCTLADAAVIPAFSQFLGGFVFLASMCSGDGPLNNPITVVLTRDDGQFTQPQHLGDGAFPTEVLSGDFDGDGSPGFIVWDRYAQVFRRFGTGFTGTYEEAGEFAFQDFCAGCSAESLVTTGAIAGQFDGAGGDDIILQHGDFTYVTQQVGQNSQITHTISVARGTLVMADFNADGVDDVLVSNSETSPTLIISNP